MTVMPASIRTPDSRLRIFVSSTLGELATERRAVRAAVEQLHLAPVMFELGARPHAPRNLYRAYLEQSDVFVGIYWQSYGWVAPGEEVSGLEDEFLLSDALPRLIYIKRPADNAEPRLLDMLDRIRTRDSASYKTFSTSEELAELLVADLATLLAERFDQSRLGAGPVVTALDDTPTERVSSLPVPLTRLIGRGVEAEEVLRMLQRDTVRLVTLTGPGGIGKSRLAIEVAERAAADFPGGAAFVDLAPVRDPTQVPLAIAQAIGVRDSGDGPLEDKLMTALKHRRLVLVIDNFEQVVDAASVLTRLLAAAPGVKMIVTSRTLLRVLGEVTFEVGPLSLPDASGVRASDAVTLFVERARAVKPDFEITADNADAVAGIARVLDGVPLALELAAAGIRMMPPRAMLARLDSQLSVLVGGVRDLPARQQALRSTIEWSTSLLTDDQFELLSVLGVFAGSFSFDAVESLVTELGGQPANPMEALAALVDNSLVRQHDRGDRAFFTMLQSVHEFALEQLQQEGRYEQLRGCHMRYYVSLGERAEIPLEGPEQREWVALLADEHNNLRAAVRYLLDSRQWTIAADFAWALYVYWWVGGRLGEVPDWMDELLVSDDPLTDRTRAIALYFTHAIRFWSDASGETIPGLTESAERFHSAGDESGEALARISLALALLSTIPPDAQRADDELESTLALFRVAGDRWGEAFALITLGRVAMFQQHPPRALNRFEESLALARSQQDLLGEAIAVNHIGWADLLLGHTDAARASFEDGLRGSARLGHDEGVAYGLEGLVAVAAMTGEYHRAGELLGAAQTLREETGLYNAASFAFHDPYVAHIRESEFADEFEASRRRGRVISADAAIEAALSAVSS